MKNNFLVLALSFILIACSGTNSKGAKNAVLSTDKTSGSVNKHTVSETGVYHSSIIEFNEDKSYLSPESRKQLEALVEQTRKNHEIKSIELASWSDKPFPLDEHSRYSTRDRKLAEMRSDSIKTYLNEALNISWFDIQSYNMADKTGVLASLFKTDSAELKSIFLNETKADKVKSAHLKIIRDSGAPSKSVVVLKTIPRQ